MKKEIFTRRRRLKALKLSIWTRLNAPEDCSEILHNKKRFFFVAILIPFRNGKLLCWSFTFVFVEMEEIEGETKAFMTQAIFSCFTALNLLILSWSSWKFQSAWWILRFNIEVIKGFSFKLNWIIWKLNYFNLNMILGINQELLRVIENYFSWKYWENFIKLFSVS